MKKIFYWFYNILFIFMVLTSTFTVSAETHVLGDNITYRAEDATLYIEGLGDMSLNFEYLTDIPWYDKGKVVETLIIGEGVTSIAEGAFSAFTALKNVTLPQTLTKIDDSAFISCTSLEKIEIPKRVTKIGVGAFAGCENLKSVVIPGSVISISSDAFYNCEMLTITGIKGSYADAFASDRKIAFDGSLPSPSEIMVKVNGKFLFFDQPPVILDDRTLVPFRSIFEALGADVDWIADSRTVVAKKNNTSISLVIDSNVLTKNGVKSTIDAPAKIVNDRTMVPARAISEALGAYVDWDPVTRTVIIEE